jgi:hypothetical protein
MSPELEVCNIVLICISEIVYDKLLMIIDEEGPKILKYNVSFCVYAYELYLYNTPLCLISSI